MKAKIKQNELAQRLGLSPSRLCMILSRTSRPSPDLAKDLESRSGVTRMTWLYSDSEQLVGDLEKSLGMKINFTRGRIKKGKK